MVTLKYLWNFIGDDGQKKIKWMCQKSSLDRMNKINQVTSK